jgi:DNA invertase Pin-like site-specific DNA recombinase
MRAAVYARVSTNNGQSPEMQLRDFAEYCDRRGWALAGEYVDIGISGTKEKRPELDRLMADAHRRKFDAVVVWSFDRMARSVSHLLRVLETFNSLGIAFVSLREQIDTSTPAGKMIFTVLGAVAELERSLIAERVRAGLRNARAKGKKLGRPIVAVDTSKVAALRANGLGWRGVAITLGIYPSAPFGAWLQRTAKSENRFLPQPRLKSCPYLSLSQERNEQNHRC